MELKTATQINEFQANHQRSDTTPVQLPQQDDLKPDGPLNEKKNIQDIHRIKGIIDEFELNQFEFQNSIIKKIADVSDDLSQKIDKVKALTDLSKSLADAENKNFTPEQFSVRNMVYQTERLLKGEISQKVSVLGKSFQADNFVIRELIREERKKHVRDMNDLTKRQAEVKKEFLDLIVKVNKDRSSTVKATEKCEKKIKNFSSELKQAVKTTKYSLDEVTEAFRDELGQNKIELKNSLKGKGRFRAKNNPRISHLTYQKIQSSKVCKEKSPSTDCSLVNAKSRLISTVSPARSRVNSPS